MLMALSRKKVCAQNPHRHKLCHGGHLSWVTCTGQLNPSPLVHSGHGKTNYLIDVNQLADLFIDLKLQKQLQNQLQNLPLKLENFNASYLEISFFSFLVLKLRPWEFFFPILVLEFKSWCFQT